MGISVKLQQFEGPLDLLLHLIDKNKVDILCFFGSLAKRFVRPSLIPTVDNVNFRCYRSKE